MSRNLCRTRCAVCKSAVELDEPPRTITPNEMGPYTKQYQGMPVANATCPMCLAQYLAWMETRTGLSPTENGICDLSYRAAFNDEPWITDLPIFHVASQRGGGFRRIAVIDHEAEGEGYWRLDKEGSYAEDRAKWMARRDEALKTQGPFSIGDLLEAAVFIDDTFGESIKKVGGGTLVWHAHHAPQPLCELAYRLNPYEHADASGGGLRGSVIADYPPGSGLPNSVRVDHEADRFILPNGWVIIIESWDHLDDY